MSEKRESLWDKFVKWFTWIMMVGCVFRVGQFLYWSWFHPLFILKGIEVLVLLVAGWFLYARWKEKRQGYSLDLDGGAEGGYVIYEEDGQMIRLYFDREDRTLYVPSDEVWQRDMPDWAKDRKAEIMRRIMKQFRFENVTSKF